MAKIHPQIERKAISGCVFVLINSSAKRLFCYLRIDSLPQKGYHVIKIQENHMKTAQFVGREAEMARLKGLLSTRSANLIVVRGRRRIGKSRLLAEFGKEIRSYFFSGNPPASKITAQSQRVVFVKQLERNGIPGVQPDDWGNIFWHLSKHTQKGRVLIVFDEISWMGGKDPEFLGHLKTAWDMYFSKNPHLVFALCGSISSWIEKNILSNTGFLGRIIIDMVLEELPLKTCNAFWHPKEMRITAYEKFKVLSVTGGVPFYLEHIKPHLSAEQNIRDLCFSKGGLLVREFDEIFSDLFSRRKGTHKEIVTCLASGPKELPEIYKELGKSGGGLYSQYLDELVKAGFVRREFTWDLKSGKYRKLSRYRLSDNYLRFYLKYISPNRAKIEQEKVPESMLNNLPNWEGVMGLQFENLVTHNYKTLWEMLNVSAEEVVMDGPFFQSPTTKQQGCQIDYMIQTRFHTLYLCEVKFKKDKIEKKILDEMEEKRTRLIIPRHFSIRPILIHVNGVDESVLDAGYFDKIIDFSQLL
ncbi:MAG: AAA family ATPase [Nitrosarchaeum sp.]|nr:AAA family ATPase [Nitrosarchaeum sp.]